MLPPRMTFASLTRIADFDQQPFGLRTLTRSAWETGDYVAGEVVRSSHTSLVELPSGRMTEVSEGDWIVGALGIRAATLESVGSWRDIGDDGLMDAMTAAGLMGKITSRAAFLGEPIQLAYRGHLVRRDKKLTMRDFVRHVRDVSLDCPVILIVGTSMSSGKTACAKVIIRRLKRMGLRVTGAKLTGAGRYRDILAMSDAGADSIFDFVDAGVPSTVCDESVYQATLKNLLDRIAESKPDVLVAEAGASPIEPYNGQIAISGLEQQVRFTVLCASDPYAVIGVTQGFGLQADLISGVATNTSAGVHVIEELAKTQALNLIDPKTHEELDRLLKKWLARK